MRKMSFVCGAVLSLAAICLIPSAHAQGNANIFAPDRGPNELGVGYQFQHYNVLGQTFHDNAFKADFSHHVFDWVTGAGWRLTVAVEGTATVGFGHTPPNPNPNICTCANSVFLGVGPRVSIESPGRIEPFLHLVPGWQHFRFAQTDKIGSNSAFGFLGGGGVDVRVLTARPVYWRVQVDYIGTTFQSSEQSNYSIGSGLIFYF